MPARINGLFCVVLYVKTRVGPRNQSYRGIREENDASFCGLSDGYSRHRAGNPGGLSDGMQQALVR